MAIVKEFTFELVQVRDLVSAVLLGIFHMNDLKWVSLL